MTLRRAVTLRRALTWLARAALLFVCAVSAVVLHWPAPSGVSGEARGAVRGVWSIAGAFADRMPSVPDVLEPFASDKTIHFGVFFVLAFLWSSSRALAKAWSARSAMLIVIVLSAYAGIGELAQVLEGRIADPWDWLANVLGTLCGVAALGSSWELGRRARDVLVPRLASIRA
jgi:VanZ family protein